MLFAMQEGVRVTATPNNQAVCTCCGATVVAKCGPINNWHWAHKNRINCDGWGESEGFWHYTLKNLFPEECREVTIEKDGVKHRADLRIKNLVIELQSSPIKFDVIKEREAFYENMIWILDGNKFIKNFEARDQEGYCNFTWKYAKRSFTAAEKPVFIALGNRIFEVKKYYENFKYGWGKMYSMRQYIESRFNIKIDTNKYLEDFKSVLLENEKRNKRYHEFLEKLNDITISQ